MTELVAQHEADFLVEDLVLALDLASVALLRRVEKACRRLHDGRARLLIFRDQLYVLVGLVGVEDFVVRAALGQVRLDVEQTVADRHHLLAALGACGERVHFTGSVIDDERDARDLLLVRALESRDVLLDHRLSTSAEKIDVGRVDGIVRNRRQRRLGWLSWLLRLAGLRRLLAGRVLPRWILVTGWRRSLPVVTRGVLLRPRRATRFTAERSGGDAEDDEAMTRRHGREDSS